MIIVSGLDEESLEMSVDMDEMVLLKWRGTEQCVFWLRGNGTRFILFPYEDDELPLGEIRPGPEPGEWCAPKMISSLEALHRRFP